MFVRTFQVYLCTWVKTLCIAWNHEDFQIWWCEVMVLSHTHTHPKMSGWRRILGMVKGAYLDMFILRPSIAKMWSVSPNQPRGHQKHTDFTPALIWESETHLHTILQDPFHPNVLEACLIRVFHSVFLGTRH